ncbi:uncharacterized protein [Maniola hyperantus]|uniref:uncharacterized protein n=1 Tax=Aphantopus hyperantus TaxID=2795564 RepID=UPI0021357BE5
MDNYQIAPVKLYIQDIFRAKQTEENRYIYEMFNLKFKRVMIHGVVTSIYNKTTKTTNFELSDPTGCVQVYYDTNKNDYKLSEDTVKDLVKSFARKSQSGHDKILAMSSMLSSIENNYKFPFDFESGSHVCVVGDIFVDNFKSSRMICAYSCKTTSVERDIVWLEELRYLYEKYYLKGEDGP